MNQMPKIQRMGVSRDGRYGHVPGAATLLVLGLIAAGCAPTVHMTTPEPLKVDISMKVDVYQHDFGGSTSRRLTDEESQALRRRDQRSTELWAMKNDSVILEGNNGYLEVKDKSGWDMAYVARMVASENQDRHVIYESEAVGTGRPIAVIEAEAGRNFRKQAYGTGGARGTPPAPASVNP